MKEPVGIVVVGSTTRCTRTIAEADLRFKKKAGNRSNLTFAPVNVSEGPSGSALSVCLSATNQFA